jgi:hypothetical protein
MSVYIRWQAWYGFCISISDSRNEALPHGTASSMSDGCRQATNTAWRTIE